MDLDDEQELPFRHNYLYDIESLRWIAMWVFYNNTKLAFLADLTLPKNTEKIFERD
ncbi:hypothetical protein QCA50_014438 [Cerrena zonata]|uniref:Uncharacterized protein n=1 Tax=Cerrena zonata TaxID=2478898 RepID=A0AAW0FYE8_9APHY